MNPSRLSFRLPRTGHTLALVAWLLLSLQVPWHTGMSAGIAFAGPANTQLFEKLGLHCGKHPSAATLAQLVDAGYVDAAQLAPPADNSHATSLCELFAGLVSPLSLAFVPTHPVYVSPAPPVAQTIPRIALPASRLPPARAPPAIRC